MIYKSNEEVVRIVYRGVIELNRAAVVRREVEGLPERQAWRLADINSMPISAFARWGSLLDNRSLDALSDCEEMKRHLAGYILLEQLLYDIGFGVSEIPAIKPDGNGIPTADIPGLNMCISHSHDMVVSVVSDSRIGVDIDCLDNVLVDCSERFFTVEELAVYSARRRHPSDFGHSLKKDFLSVWTAKEAVAKCKRLDFPCLPFVNGQAPEHKVVYAWYKSYLLAFAGKRVTCDNLKRTYKGSVPNRLNFFEK